MHSMACSAELAPGCKALPQLAGTAWKAPVPLPLLHSDVLSKYPHLNQHARFKRAHHVSPAACLKVASARLRTAAVRGPRTTS